MFRENTKEIRIGDRVIGGKNPILIQSMTNTKTEDVEATVAQIKALTEAEDSKMLFGEPAPTVVGNGDPIGLVNKGNNPTGATAQMRAIMGLPPINEK